MSSQALRNFASYVAKEESIPTRFNMESVNGPVEQKMLVINKRKEAPKVSTETAWSRLFSRAPALSTRIMQ